MADLRVDFCGLKLINPFLIAPSPASDSRSKAERALQAGWAGIVFKTAASKEHAPKLAEPNMGSIGEMGLRNYTFYNYDLISERSIEEVCRDIRYLKTRYPDRILIGSIMGSSREEWRYLTECLEKAGADMIEVSASCPQGDQDGRIPAADAEALKEITAVVKNAAEKGTPVLVKLTPNVTDITAMAAAAESGGADSVCAIDTVRAFCGLDLETGRPRLNVNGFAALGGLSGAAIKPIALGCVAAIAKSTSLPVGGIGGIGTYGDAAEFILLGSSIVEVCTAVTRLGFGMIKDLCQGLSDYMDQQGYGSVDEMRGKSLSYIVRQEELDRNFHSVCRVDKTRCARCGQCVTACQDGGFGALKKGKDGCPEIDEGICRGCGACLTVCRKMCLELCPLSCNEN